MPILKKPKKAHREILEEYKKLKEEQKKINDRLDYLKLEIDVNVPCGEFDCGDFTVNIIQKKRMIEDKAAIKKALGKKYDQLKKPSLSYYVYFNDKDVA